MKLDLHVNLDKKQTLWFLEMVNTSPYYDGQSISVVNSYTYLSLFLTTRMTFFNAVDETANKAMKGVIDILRTVWRLGNFSATIF